MATSVTESPIEEVSSTLPEPTVMPTLLGVGYGNYEVQPNNFIYSFALHILVVAGIFAATHFLVSHSPEIKNTVISLVDPADIPLPASPDKVSGGGGGGDASKLDASKGHPPKLDLNQITPPTVINKVDPKLAVEQSIAVPPQIRMQTSQINVGDQLSKALLASNGVGVGSGIGTGANGGIGSGNGRGLGPGSQAGVGGGIFHVGGGVSAPVATYSPDPEYSEEARKAKYQGTVLLSLIVDADGRPRDLQVAQSLGMGLDEKAIEAVRTWKFDPAKKDGHPVPVRISVEVAFRLY